MIREQMNLRPSYHVRREFHRKKKSRFIQEKHKREQDKRVINLILSCHVERKFHEEKETS